MVIGCDSCEAVLPRLPGEGDAGVQLHQSHVKVIELGHISVLESFDVEIWVDENLTSDHFNFFT